MSYNRVTPLPKPLPPIETGGVRGRVTRKLDRMLEKLSGIDKGEPIGEGSGLILVKGFYGRPNIYLRVFTIEDYEGRTFL